MISKKQDGHEKCLMLASLVLASVFLAGCEKDNAAWSVVAPGKKQQNVQSSGISLKPLPTQIGVPTAISANTSLMNSNNPRELAMRADSYFESQRYSEAIALYEKAIFLDSRDVDSMNDLGLAYFYVGQPGKALASLSNATTTDPAYQNAWLSTGYILLSLKHYDEAVQPLQKARDLDPSGAVGQEAQRFLNKIQQIKGN